MGRALAVFIRIAHAEELPLLPGVERAAAQLFRATPYAWIAGDSPHDLADFQRWASVGAVFVAVHEAAGVIGFAAAEAIDGQGYLAELDVHPDYGRQGLGRRLIEAVEAWSLARGHTSLRLSTFVDVPWNAPYYARLGFRPLAGDALGPGLRAVRQAEAEGGLDPGRRVFMELARPRSVPRSS